jgi:xanthine dehydrogenase accessory factor
MSEDAAIALCLPIPSLYTIAMFNRHLTLIKGAGDLASGVALRLHRSGFWVVMTDIAAPLTVRRTVAFAQAIFDGTTQVEGIEAVRASADQATHLLEQGKIPVIIDPAASSVERLKPAVVVDAIIAKRNLGTRLDDAPLVIGLGPGFSAGTDCHAVIETNRGHDLGRVIWQGSAEPDTGQPGTLPGMAPTVTRVLRAPIAGYVHAQIAVGSQVTTDQLIAVIQGENGASAELHAPFAGVLRGLVHAGVAVPAGLKIGDLDPRARPEYCFTVSDKSLAIAGGVLEAILTMLTKNKYLGSIS